MNCGGHGQETPKVVPQLLAIDGLMGLHSYYNNPVDAASFRVQHRYGLRCYHSQRSLLVISLRRQN